MFSVRLYWGFLDKFKQQSMFSEDLSRMSWWIPKRSVSLKSFKHISFLNVLGTHPHPHPHPIPYTNIPQTYTQVFTPSDISYYDQVIKSYVLTALYLVFMIKWC